MSRIAFFDFDGTITTHDTMLELAKFYKGKKAFYKGMLVLLPALVAMKLKMLSNAEVKQKLLTLFFKGIPEPEFQKICVSYKPGVILLLSMFSLYHVGFVPRSHPDSTASYKLYTLTDRVVVLKSFPFHFP